MDAAAITQLVTLAVAVLAIIWHQQRTTDRVRADVNSDIRELRSDINSDIRELRSDFNAANREQREANGKMSDGIAQNGQRLARIEGHFGIGMPVAADAEAAATEATGAVSS